MNIKILDSWLRDYLKTDATAKEIAEKLSLTSVSIERVTRHGSDYIYDIEITTNRPDLASVVGLAREAAAILPQFDIKAEFIPPKLPPPVIASDRRERGNLEIAKPVLSEREGSHTPHNDKLPLEIINDPKLVNRICAVVMEVTIKNSPNYIKDRLEASDIRSLNNLIDVTNYVMRTIGHPTHVFDYDRIEPKEIVVRESKKGEKIMTFDEKSFVLPGGDIVADNGDGQIIDLLGIMGLENSVVTDNTKRIIFFIDNNDPKKMRSTSMKLGIRSDAVQLNEKGIDPELAYDALLFGIKLYEEIAEGKVASKIIDIYPNKPKEKKITISEEKINSVVGINIPIKKSADILTKLGFKVSIGDAALTVIVPTIRADEVTIPEDLIEEIARVYGYHNLPSVLPPVTQTSIVGYENDYYWEKRVKNALKYWGFTEVYSYSMVSEALFEGPLENAVTIKNPLTVDWEYMRISIVPSLLQIISENKKSKQARIFEIANVYEKTALGLPNEKLHLAGVIKKPKASFFEIKGVIEQLASDMGIANLQFKALDQGSREITVKIGKEHIGDIEILDDNLIDFEIDFTALVHHTSLRKTFMPIPKYPPIIEDISFIANEDVATAELLKTISEADKLIAEVILLDRYKDARTFHILYQHPEKNLSTEDVQDVRKHIIKSVQEKHNARLKT